MASNYLKYNSPVTNGGTAVQTAVDQVLTAWRAFERIKAEMDALVGSPADYTQLTAAYGLVVGTEQAFYNHVAAIKANLDTACPDLANLDATV